MCLYFTEEIRVLFFLLTKWLILLNCQLHEGIKKSGIMGFCDPCPGEPKQLFVEYSFNRQEHQVYPHCLRISLSLSHSSLYHTALSQHSIQKNLFCGILSNISLCRIHFNISLCVELFLLLQFFPGSPVPPPSSFFLSWITCYFFLSLKQAVFDDLDEVLIPKESHRL